MEARRLMQSVEAKHAEKRLDPANATDLAVLETTLIGRVRGEQRRAAISRLTSPLLVIVAFVLSWELAVRGLDVATYLVPPPTMVAETIVEEWSVLWTNALLTLRSILVGFALAAVGGVLLAVITYNWKPFERGVYPLVVAMQAVPKVALAPMLALWFGFGLTTRSLMAFLLALFPVLTGTLVGLRSIAPEKILLARSIGLGAIRTFLTIRFPQALPSIFGGLRVALVLSSVGAIVGEFVGGAEGLGYLIVRANHDLNTALMFAALVVLAAFALVLFMILELLERRLLPWHQSQADVTVVGA